MPSFFVKGRPLLLKVFVTLLVWASVASAALSPYLDSDYILSFSSSPSVSIVLNTALENFDLNSFKSTLFENYFVATLSGETLNSDAVDGATTTTAAPNNATADAERLQIKTDLLANFVLLEVCAYDVSTGSDRLKSDNSAFYDWPLQQCGERYGKVSSGQGRTAWGGTLVRFSFMTVPSVKGRIDAGGIKGVYNTFDDSAAAADRKYLVNVLSWQKLMGHVAPTAASDRTATPPSAVATGFTTIAFIPTAGQMTNRPLATVSNWGPYIEEDTTTSRVVDLAASNPAVTIIVLIIIVLILVCCCTGCIYYCWFQRKKAAVGGKQQQRADSRADDVRRGLPSMQDDGAAPSYAGSANQTNASDEGFSNVIVNRNQTTSV